MCYLISLGGTKITKCPPPLPRTRVYIYNSSSCSTHHCQVGFKPKFNKKKKKITHTALSSKSYSEKWRTQWLRSPGGYVALCSRPITLSPLISYPLSPYTPLTPTTTNPPPPTRTSQNRRPLSTPTSTQFHLKTPPIQNNKNALSTIGPSRTASTLAFTRRQWWGKQVKLHYRRSSRVGGR